MASGPATDTPPYASAARISDSQCYPQYTASLKCKGKLGWNAIEAGPSSHELLLGDPSPLYPTIVSNRLNFELIWSGDPSLVA
ncbi:hypothetical protein WN943_017903 [Citrus x changshan-huyou]